MMERYLTDEEKLIEVARWIVYRSDATNQAPPDQEGGWGYPDPDVFELTDMLNAIEGVLTDQSCAGHLHSGETPGETSMWDGKLWLRLSEPMMERFTADAYRLYESPTIERLQRIFHRDVGDIVEIIFQGNNRGKLAESGAAIVAFFSQLAER